MRKLLQKNTDIALTLAALTNGFNLTKIDDGAGIYDPVYTKILDVAENWRKLSIAYGFIDDDGIFHSDPEVHILYLNKYGQMIPYYVKTGDGETTSEQKVAEFDNLGRITWEASPGEQREVHLFVSSFLQNIAQQQDLSGLFDRLEEGQENN